MALHAVKVTLEDIQIFRVLFRQETNAQIRYDSCHWRGWTDSYLLKVDDVPVGYGSIKGRDLKDRDTIFEFYVIPPFRNLSRLLFAELIATARPTHLESQSNDALTTAMLHEFARDVNARAVLFADHVVTQYEIPGAVVRPRRDDDKAFEHNHEPLGDYVLELDGEVVATAGFLLHYNVPFADLYMEVRPDSRRRGFGTFILQEVKKACYLAGRIPAARTGLDNIPSRATLTKAGLRACGFILLGEVKPAPAP